MAAVVQALAAGFVIGLIIRWLEGSGEKEGTQGCRYRPQAEPGGGEISPRLAAAPFPLARLAEDAAEIRRIRGDHSGSGQQAQEIRPGEDRGKEGETGGEMGRPGKRPISPRAGKKTKAADPRVAGAGGGGVGQNRQENRKASGGLGGRRSHALCLRRLEEAEEALVLKGL